MANWDDYRMFLTVARERTLAAAARRLRVDQSTVGRRLSALENDLATRLFERTSRGYALTEAGRAVLPRAEEIERAALAAERRSLGEDARLDGRVHLATSDSFATWFLLPRLGPFIERHPAILLELVLGDAPVDLAGRQADLSLRFRKPTQPGLVARRLAQAAWAVYATPGYLQRHGTPKEPLASGHEVLGFDEALAGTVGARWLKEHGGGARQVLTSTSLLSLASAAEAGLGLAILPCIFGDVSRHLRRVGRTTVGHHDLWLVVHADVRTSARVRAVMDFVIALVKQNEALLKGETARRARARSATRETPR